ncbi:hypothetical protein ALC62_04347 [Cyphomyrmex costatus]|uniref:Uncharacterized protein n=1 Tax=Cyphomyrmex costatus TaxID=456900 RepID=A0A151IKE7_9HYME|nr:hypothetical protein ALC62_14200 [Cyphomyrmex costatus]KYN04788.1 hypothetical protein ALC62_04347 [Cyphomyrmex costatus]
MENSEERILLDRSSCTARLSKQDPNQSTSTSQCQSQFWSSLQPTTSDDSAQDGDEFAKEEPNEHLEALKFVFPKKVKARGGRKANVSKRRVTFADH